MSDINETRRRMRAVRNQLLRNIEGNLGIEQGSLSEERDQAVSKRQQAINVHEQKIRELVSDPNAIDRLTDQERDFYRAYANQIIKSSETFASWTIEQRDMFLKKDSTFGKLLTTFGGLENFRNEKFIEKYRMLLILLDAFEERKKRLPQGGQEKVKAQLTEIQCEIDRLNGERNRKLENALDEDDKLRVNNRYDNLIHQLEQEALGLKESLGTL